MIRVKCDKCGTAYPQEGAHECSPGADNAQFDEKAWRKAYMREYMKKWRKRVRELKQELKEQAS